MKKYIKPETRQIYVEQILMDSTSKPLDPNKYAGDDYQGAKGNFMSTSVWDDDEEE